MFNSYKLLDKGLLTIGDLTFIYSIFTLLLTSIKNLINLNRNINESKLSYYRINNLLNKEISKALTERKAWCKEQLFKYAHKTFPPRKNIVSRIMHKVLFIALKRLYRWDY